MNAREYVVTFRTRNASRTQVWDSRSPLMIGHPFRFLLERTSEGVRAREISGATGEWIDSPVRALSSDQISKGQEIELPGLKVRVRKTRAIAPAFDSSALSGPGELRVFQCSGNWVTRAVRVESATCFKAEGQEAFVIAPEGAGFRISKKAAALEALGGAHSLESVLGRETLASLVLKLGPHLWRFGFSTLSDGSIRVTRDADPTAEAFKKSLIASGGMLGAVLILALLWPKKPKETELVPEQFTRIVMAKPKPMAELKPSAPAGAAGTVGQAEAPKKVQNTAVVQAFRAQALQSAVSGLLKGGMTSLLAQSDFVAGTAQSAQARKLLDSRNKNLHNAAPEAGTLNSHSVNIAAVGGQAGGGGNGKAVGYGKGERASVKGQGQGQIAIDYDSADIAEGLTKDEVGAVIHRHLSEIRYCYESAMIRQADIEGKLMMNFTIGGTGAVKTAEVKQSTLTAQLDDCILRRLMTWKFPQTKGGVDVTVTYPFIFKTLGR